MPIAPCASAGGERPLFVRWRRLASALSPFYRDEHLYVDLRHELVILDRQVLTLTQKEYCLLLLLVRHAGETLPRKTFDMRVWGHVLSVQSRQVDIHIRWLRKKLGIYTESSGSRRSTGLDTISCQHLRTGVGACSLCRRHRQLKAGYGF